jgi:ABC-type branched-subunit amino acid transport system permease subunit
MIAAATKFKSVWASCGLAAIAMVLMPQFFNDWELLQAMIYVIMAILALSLAFIWGFGGILSFGQGVFFGLGAYVYAIAALNFGETTGALVLAILIPALFAAALGYFLFYGRISDVYLGAITLTVTLIFFDLMNSTSGPQYRIGQAALGGFNGMPAIPQLNVPGFPGWSLSTTQLFCVCVGALAIVYACLKMVVASDFGRLVVAIRENETRAELLGYDSRRFKLVTFVIGGGIAGLAGCLFANWGAYTSPTVFALGQSVQIIIWVVVGGVGTFVGPILGCFLIQWLTNYVGAQSLIDTSLVLGTVLTLFVLLLPSGLVPSARQMLQSITGRRRKKSERNSTSTMAAREMATEISGGRS